MSSRTVQLIATANSQVINPERKSTHNHVGNLSRVEIWLLNHARVLQKSGAAYLRQKIESMLPIFLYDDAAANWHAIERARLSKQGRTPPYIDGQIAAIAVTNQLILVTRNISDYKSFQGLRLENWFE